MVVVKRRSVGKEVIRDLMARFMTDMQSFRGRLAVSPVLDR